LFAEAAQFLNVVLGGIAECSIHLKLKTKKKFNAAIALAREKSSLAHGVDLT